MPLVMLGSSGGAKEWDVSTYFWGLLALIALAVTLLLLSIGTFYARRLEAEPKLPFGEEIGRRAHACVWLRGGLRGRGVMMDRPCGPTRSRQRPS